MQKVLLELWSSASDNVRIAAFLAVRKLFVGGDDSIRDICLKVNVFHLTQGYMLICPEHI